ncbi:TIGR04283 family arsenosugar biosynthesis glycosyltransferase [Hymenobacter sp. BT186]|uniref:TIGR04283 family arsenosugar biosynthesis glycosyltransferase n=1 Tax=Hymenobacter telluris TaxID=2816474 RepID=A0A939EZK7_9BACT|nr:TIGR04283 family arsenosugar biosynthesis glycosyltransferase [Hymenobacter telluris]MBO0360378.1 TIGR04283 family arsenosugar biosynthesis glycosyltransferase [Hymenobacter telluris]MBW3376405.1 TIGR04283 family arsenosugar biosynthesis glycosyltransferase [Hymenobacter norwichensis]
MRSVSQPTDSNSPASISIIIPTYKEAGQIGSLLRHVRAAAGPDSLLEIVVVDAYSPDSTAAEARQAGARVVLCPRKGRAAQLNFGATQARGSILYFLHADTYPPVGFTHDISEAVARGAGAGCYRLAFDHPSWFLKSNAWFTRFSLEVFRFGDQSLFVRHEVFAQAGGYREDMVVFEDQEITRRLKRLAPFRVLPGPIVTSARKYRDNGVWRLQGIYYLITAMYRLGMSQQKMVNVYRKLIRQDKV